MIFGFQHGHYQHDGHQHDGQSPHQTPWPPYSARSKARASQGRSLSRSNGRRLNPKNSCFEWPPFKILDIRSNGPEGGSSSAPPGATPPSFRILIKTRCGPPERGFGVDLPQILVGLGVGLTWFNMAGCHLAEALARFRVGLAWFSMRRCPFGRGLG